ERFPSGSSHQYNDLIRQNFGTTSHGTAVTTSLSNYRCRFTRNGTLINGSKPFDDFSITCNNIPSSTNEDISFLQLRRRDCSAIFQFCWSLLSSFTEAVCLSLSSSLS